MACLLAGKYVDLKDTIEGFKGILDGKYDSLPEQVDFLTFLTTLSFVLHLHATAVAPKAHASSQAYLQLLLTLFKFG